MTDAVIKGMCHCGEVGFEISERPGILVECNCTVCRRYGSLWGHIDRSAYSRIGSGTTKPYLHGERMIAFHTCTTCGGTTHWENHHPENTHMAVNFRMCEPGIISQFTIRQFDGFDTWEFLD